MMTSKFDKMVRSIIYEMYNDVTDEEVDSFDFDKFDKGPKEAVANHDDTELPVYNHMNLKIALLDSYTSRRALLIYGDPGIGKSDVVKNVAKNMIAPELDREYVNWNKLTPDRLAEVMDNPDKYFCLIDRRAAELEPIDLRGIEMPTSRSPYLDPKIPKWIYYMIQPGSGGLLFLDEINQATDQVLNAFFGVVLDRQAGDVSFAPDWNIVAAGNLGAEHITTNDIPPALSQRFGTIMLVADPNQWFEWAEEANIDPLIIGFVKSRPGDNFYVKSQSSAESMPNPRNFATLSNEIRAIKRRYISESKRGKPPTENIYSVIERTASHTCGTNWGRAFGQFVELYRKLDWIEMAQNAKNYNTKDVSNQYAYLLFVADRSVKLFGKGSQHSVLSNQLAQQERADPNTKNPENWKPIYEDVERFLLICQGMLEGREEMLTTLINMLNKRDDTVVTTILSAMARNMHEPLVQKMKSTLQAAKAISDGIK